MVDRIRLAEPFVLCALAIRVKVFEVLDQWHLFRFHYRDANFRRADRSLRARYRFRNPYRIHNRFFRAQGSDDLDTYGETPLKTLETLAALSELDEDDHVFELGCGRGRATFWLRTCLRCSVVGVELVPAFVELDEATRVRAGLDRIEFREEDFLETDLDGATFIYLSGTCLSDDVIRQLAMRFATLPPGTRILTISYPLSDYASPGHFRLLGEFPARFAWGQTSAYLQERSASHDS